MKYCLITFLLLFSGNWIFGQTFKVTDERKLDLGLEDKILVENHLASNPRNKKHLLLSGMFVDSKDFSNYGNFAAVSFDKGKTWTNGTIFNVPEGADPWGIISDQNTYLSTVLGLEELFLFRSKNNGKEWTQQANFGKYHDHQTMVQDTTRNIVYLVSVQGNDIYVNHSKDDGRTFDNEDKFKFSNLGTNTMTPVVLSDGTLMISFTTFNRPAINGSRNDGKAERLSKTLSWLLPYNINKGFKTPLFLSEACETGFPVLEVDRSSGKYRDNLYYVCSSQSDKNIVFHYSDTKGESWSEGAPIGTYTNEDRSLKNPFTGIPQVVVNNRGIIGVIWQGRQDSGNDCQYLYFTASFDGGKTFLKPKQVSSELSCMEREENGWAGKRYKSGGDYTGFATNENGDFLIIWPDSRDGIAQLYMSTVTIKK